MTGCRSLLVDLCAIVGRRHLLTGDRATLRFRRGFRSPAGSVLAVARPGTLVEMWRLLARLVTEDVAIIVQAANTGLTGGSTPDERIDRPVVVLNVMRLRGIHLIDAARQAISLPGATLIDLEQRLAPFGREPHSVIGSSCFGASVIGGICNNSGGALVRRGPAYSEMSIFARVDGGGRLELVNRLGFDLGAEPEEILARLEGGDFTTGASTGAGSAVGYESRVRAIEADTPARFNADPAGLCDAAGSAGRIAVFAVRTDSFPRTGQDCTYYIGTNDPADLTALRRRMLASPIPLPISAEYIHRDAFDVADRYGRDIFQTIRWLGTKRLPALYAAKAFVDQMGTGVGIADLSDRLLYRIGRLLPRHLPARARAWRDRFEHHLILKVEGDAAAETRQIAHAVLAAGNGAMFVCTPAEAERVMLHRFVVASAAVRFLAVRRRLFSGLVSLDIALPRKLRQWHGAGEAAPAGSIAARLVYGHFFCHVFHRDYLVAAGFDPAAVKSALLASLDTVGAEYPAEHNVGRQYRAKPALRKFYRELDPTNRFNPGVGQTPVGADWAELASSGEKA